jgi:hypothetical protein
VVEQGTHKPLVGSSNLPPGTQDATSIAEPAPKEQATPIPFCHPRRSRLRDAGAGLVCTGMDVMHNHFVWGAALGIVIGLAGMILLTLRLWESRREVKRLQRHLADKLELEADATNRLKTDLQQLKQQNENLRIKVASLGQLPDRKLQRDIEIYARAERYMVSRSPGFPAAWEEAKRNSVEELESEENGHSLPRRVFNALLNRPSKVDSSVEERPSEG